MYPSPVRLRAHISAFILVALAPLTAGAAEGVGPTFRFSFLPSSLELSGPAGTRIRAELMCTIETLGNPRAYGAGGWQLSVEATDGVSITEVGMDGTDAGRLFRDGFRYFELTHGTDNEGFICGVVLAFRDSSTLPPRGKATVAAMTVEALCPAPGQTRRAQIRYRDNLTGKGLPIRNMVSLGIDRYDPELGRLEVTVRSGPIPRFVRGDLDGNGRISLGDPIGILSFLFIGEELSCREAGDVDDDGRIRVTDAVRLLTFLFLESSPPATPFPACGVDPTPSKNSASDCQTYSVCR